VLGAGHRLGQQALGVAQGEGAQGLLGGRRPRLVGVRPVA
jgi:hypothetical protein